MSTDIYAVINDEGDVKVTHADVPHTMIYTEETDGYAYWRAQAVAQTEAGADA